MKIYLATPYSSNNYLIEESRFRKVNKKAGELIKQGHIVFSPISHSHPIALEHPSMPRDAKFWMKQSEEFIGWCDELWVYKQKGWENSVGVNKEIRIARELNKQILYIEDE